MLSYLYRKVGFILKSLLFEKFIKYAMLRAAFLGIMGIITFLFPEFLLNGMVYVIGGYVILNGALSIVGAVIHGRNDNKTTSYVNIVISCLLIICGMLSIVYHRYLISILPVFLGSLMMIEGIVYFIIALRLVTKTKLLLIFISVFIMIGGIASNIFTFGFGGLPILSQIFGTLLLLSCLYELIAYLVYRKTVK